MNAWFVFRRELRAFVFSPQTYAIGAAYLILSGIFFVNILISSEIPDLRQYYENVATTLLVLVPIVAMRSFAEERRTGALDVTLAWPMSRAAVVLGKFAANTLYLWLLSVIVWQYYRLVGNVADIDTGRTMGGFIGLLLMAMAFSALALMVSARAGSPAAAAFLGFGLLLFLWILDYAPGWIGDWLRDLGPSEHFSDFPRGAVYWEDVAYFVLVTAVGVGLAVSALDRDRPGRKARSLVSRAVGVGGVVVLTSASVALAGDVEGNVDLTTTKQNTLTEITRTAIAKLEGQRVRITGFADPFSAEADQITSLVKQFRSDGAKISLEIIDPDVQPGKARALGISGYGQALVRLGDRHEVLEDPQQGSLTSAILRLNRERRPVVCFTAGHGERDFNDRTEVGVATLASVLRGMSFAIEYLALGAAGGADALEECAIVIVAGARTPLLESELALLSDHAQESGRLLVLPDPVATEANEQLNELLDPWGVQFGKSIVRDASSLAGDPTSIVTLDYPSGASPVVNQLAQQDLPVVLTNPLPILHDKAAEEAGAYIELVQSSPKSWLPTPEGDKVNRKGPFALAALADWSRVKGIDTSNPEVMRTRIGVVGSVDAFTNRIVDILGNRQFTTALIQWVAQEDDVIAAGRPLSGFNKVVLTKGQRDRLVREGIVFPTLALLIPLPVAVLRLKRG